MISDQKNIVLPSIDIKVTKIGITVKPINDKLTVTCQWITRQSSRIEVDKPDPIPYLDKHKLSRLKIRSGIIFSQNTTSMSEFRWDFSAGIYMPWKTLVPGL